MKPYKVLDVSSGTDRYGPYLEEEINKLAEQGYIVICSIGNNLILYGGDPEDEWPMEDYPSQGC